MSANAWFQRSCDARITYELETWIATSGGRVSRGFASCPGRCSLDRARARGKRCRPRPPFPVVEDQMDADPFPGRCVGILIPPC